MPSPSVALLDPGLAGVAGHHLDLDLRLIAELKRRGYATTVYSHQAISGEAARRVSAVARLVPIFANSPYRMPALLQPDVSERAFDPITGAIAHPLDIANRVEQELKTVSGHDWWLWPSLSSPLLLASARCSPDVPVRGYIHVEPEFGTPLGRELWRYAFTSFGPGIDLRMGVPTPELAAAYAGIFAERRAELWPTFCGAPTIPRLRTEMRLLGFFGHQERTEKGLALIETLTGKLLCENYEVLLQNSGESWRPRQDGLLTVAGFVDDLGIPIGKCDLVIAPYNPVAYATKGSGIVWEAIASGAVVVAPADSSPGRLVGKFGSGVLFDEFNPTAILAAVNLARKCFPELAAAAFAAAVNWNQGNGIAQLVDAMLPTTVRVQQENS